MGNCSVTTIFDDVGDEVIDKSEIPVKVQVRIMTAVYKALIDVDWDCEGDSKYFNHPVFLTAEYSVYGAVERYSEEADDNVDASHRVLQDCL